MLLLVKELGQQISATFNTGIIKSNQAIPEEKFKLSLFNDDKNPRHMYWLAKLHKNPPE